MIYTFCIVYTEAPEETVNSIADNMRTMITDTEVDVDIECEETILVEETEDITTTDDVCELAKSIARASNGHPFKFEGKIKEYDELETDFEIEFNGEQLLAYFTPKYMVVPQNSVESYDDFCQYICWIDEKDFDKLSRQNLYLIDGSKPVDDAYFEEPIALEWK